jgi:hypothetical protein
MVWMMTETVQSIVKIPIASWRSVMTAIPAHMPGAGKARAALRQRRLVTTAWTTMVTVQSIVLISTVREGCAPTVIWIHVRARILMGVPFVAAESVWGRLKPAAATEWTIM